jgi:hypothetical protein
MIAATPLVQSPDLSQLNRTQIIKMAIKKLMNIKWHKVFQKGGKSSAPIIFIAANA